MSEIDAAQVHVADRRHTANPPVRKWLPSDPVWIMGHTYRWEDHHVERDATPPAWSLVPVPEVPPMTPVKVVQGWTPSPCADWNAVQRLQEMVRRGWKPAGMVDR